MENKNEYYVLSDNSLLSKQQIYERTKENAISEWNHNTGKDKINT